jgi:aminopeptidase N
MDEYSASQNPDVQQSITLALCSTKDVTVAKQLLSWGLGKDGVVRQQDIDHWFAYLMRNYRTRSLAWDWLVDSWDRMVELFMGGKHLEFFIWYASGSLSTPEWEAKFHKFFEPKLSEPGLKRNIQIAYSEIAARVAWRARDEEELKKYLKSSAQ